MKLYQILSLASLLAVSACSTTNITDAQASKSKDKSRSFATVMDDQSIELQVAKIIVDDKTLNDTTRILGLSHKGNVLLIGQAPTKELKAHIEQSISNIEGLNIIYNEIRLGGPITVGSQTTDSWLTTKIKTKLYNKDGIPLGAIKVVTENDEVFLIGTVTPKQSEVAVEIARNVDGVRKVIKVFEITQ